MLKLLIILSLLVLLFCFAIPCAVRAYARKIADQIIYGKGVPIISKLERCVAFLTWTNMYITYYIAQDRFRIRKLNDMLKEMQKPHG